VLNLLWLTKSLFKALLQVIALRFYMGPLQNVNYRERTVSMKNRLSRLGRSRKSLPDVHQFCSLAQILDSTLINRFVYLVTILIDQLCCLILIQGCDFNLNIVSIRVFVLYVLRRTKTLELTVNHYTNLRA
jgi:hypothetical protein